MVLCALVVSRAVAAGESWLIVFRSFGFIVKLGQIEGYGLRPMPIGLKVWAVPQNNDAPGGMASWLRSSVVASIAIPASRIVHSSNVDRSACKGRLS